MNTSSTGVDIAGAVLRVEVARRWRLVKPWHVEIRRRDSGRLVRRLEYVTYLEAEASARRIEKDLTAVPLDSFCHTYLIPRAKTR